MIISDPICPYCEDQILDGDYKIYGGIPIHSQCLRELQENWPDLGEKPAAQVSVPCEDITQGDLNQWTENHALALSKNF